MFKRGDRIKFSAYGFKQFPNEELTEGIVVNTWMEHRRGRPLREDMITVQRKRGGNTSWHRDFWVKVPHEPAGGK